MPKEGKIDGYEGLGCSFSGRSASGRRRRRLGPHQVQFAAIQQFPLDSFAALQANGGGQRQGKADVKTGLLALRSHDLNFQRIGRLHFFQKSSCFDGARLYTSAMPDPKIIPFGLPLPQVLPTIEGKVDYRQLRDQLLHIDLLLIGSGV